ncbi:MAG TPA: gamma-glutamyltransferase family protein [Burkholderiales bacterium]|nr:gamma-glutamyltransferase family protein [Burkholderiales bacterium]
MTQFNWEFPYASQRMPVLAANAIATSQPLAAQAGVRMLLKGGNAIDAALATAISLTVVEPTMNGIGSDAFALVWDGAGLHGLNASGRAPVAWTPERFALRRSMPATGWDAVTVPGVVSAWAALSAKFGRLPFAELFAPAIGYAETGFLISPTVARQWQTQAPQLMDQPGFAQAFLPEGRPPMAGELFRNPAQARTLQAIAESRGEAFYRGALAEKIAAASRAQGGAMTAADLAAHQPDWVEPIGLDYRGLRLHEIPPNGQGIAALIALGILGNFDLAAAPVDSADSLHLQMEAMKLGFADAYRFVADPRSMTVSAASLLDRDYLRRRAALIDRTRAQDFGHGVPPESGTIYLAAADAGGMMVSYIQSNYNGFGSGVVVPETGISLQNRGFGFSLEPGHPNQVGPGKRPFHTIIPAFATRQGQPLMSLGVMGADMQPQGHVQMLVRLADYGQNPQAAADAPRWKVFRGRQIALENAIPSKVAAELALRGHQVRHTERWNMEFGSAQLIYRVAGGYVAASDPRRDGQAVGF